MKFDIRNQYIVLKVEEKKTVNLYTLIDSVSGEKIVSIGVKDSGVNHRDLADVTITFKTQNERIETGEGVKYVEVLTTFVSKISKVSLNES